MQPSSYYKSSTSNDAQHFCYPTKKIVSCTKISVVFFDVNDYVPMDLTLFFLARLEIAYSIRDSFKSSFISEGGCT